MQYHGPVSAFYECFWGLLENIMWSKKLSSLSIIDTVIISAMFITRVSEVIMFLSCVFVCLCLYHDVCPDDLTMKDWCHTNNILQVHCWGCLVVMLCTAQLPGPVLKAFGWVQFSPLQLADKSPMITDQHTAGGSVSQLSQLAKLSHWLTLSTKYITTSFWHYIKSFCFWSKQIMGLYNFSNPTE